MIEDVRRNLGLFLVSQKNEWKKFLVYRLQSVLWMVFFLIIGIMGFITITVIYNVSNGINGWTYYQLLVISSFSSIAGSLIGFFLNSQQLVRDMRDGEFDKLLTKPYNPLLLIFSRYGSIIFIFSALSSFAILIYALSNIKLHLLSLIFAVFLFLLGSAALLMFMLFISFIAYILFKSGNFMGFMRQIAGNAAEYPLQIYGPIGMVILSVAVPVGIASFYPAEIMFSKINYGFGISIAIFAIALTYILYKVNIWLLRFYTSAGG